MSSNGSVRCPFAFLDLLTERQAPVRKTRPYRPQTNGKAEAFLKVLANKWAHGETYPSNEKRAAMLGPFLRKYSLFRPHGGIGAQPPITRLR